MRTTEIVLVDDNPADTDLIAEVWARNGRPSNNHAITDGVEAISFLRREQKYAHALVPDFVILDLNLPKKDGRALLAEVKADTFLRKIPIAIFSTSEASQLRTGGELLCQQAGQPAKVHLRCDINRRFLVWFSATTTRGERMKQGHR
jgi:CheY-like chemotaxis protein